MKTKNISVKRCLLLIVTAILALCLVGCGTQTYYLQINDDDTCTFKISLLVNKETYNRLPAYGIDVDQLNREKNTSTNTSLDNVDALFQEAAAIFQQYDFVITPISDAINIGFEAEKTYLTIADINQEIKTLHQMGLIGVDFEIMKEETRYKKDYKCYGTLDYVLDPDVNMEDEFISKMFKSTFSDTDSLKCSFNVIMPYSTQVSATDGKSGPQGFTWENAYNGEQVPVHIISGVKNKSAYAITIVVAVILGAALFILGYRFIRRYKALHPKKDNYDYNNGGYDDDDDDF